MPNIMHNNAVIETFRTGTMADFGEEHQQSPLRRGCSARQKRLRPSSPNSALLSSKHPHQSGFSMSVLHTIASAAVGGVEEQTNQSKPCDRDGASTLNQGNAGRGIKRVTAEQLGSAGGRAGLPNTGIRAESWIEGKVSGIWWRWVVTLNPILS